MSSRVLKTGFMEIGSTGERICLVGGSAAGHLMLDVLMKAIQYGIRLPDGFLCIYPALSPYFLPSPSRLLCLLDPVLPLEFAIHCFQGNTLKNGNWYQQPHQYYLHRYPYRNHWSFHWCICLRYMVGILLYMLN